MKKTLLLLAIGSSYFLTAQLQVNVLQLTTNDLVYDAVSKKIYASIPSANGSNGNSIGIINPANYTLEKTVFIGSEPSVLAISDNGQVIYTGFNGSSTIRKFDVSTQTAGLQFSLGSDSSTGPNYAEDIEVMPGQTDVIAVSRKNSGYSPRHEGVAIFDNGVMRPTTTPDHSGSNKIKFTSENSLIGYNNESTEYGIRKMAVNNGGVTVTSTVQSVLSGFYLDFTFKNNRMYATNGQVADVAGNPFIIGQFSNVNGPVVFDSYYNRVAFASYDYSGNITFKKFNPDTFLMTDNLPITQSNGNVKSIITCGNGCYAFNTTDNKVIIIKDSRLSTTDSAKRLSVSIYPNPTADFVNVNSDKKISEVAIYDLTGKIVKSVSGNQKKLDVSSLSKGVYIVKITDEAGNITREKLIKK